MVIGDVVRVVLLFYLMPLWAVLLARLLLREALTARRSVARRTGVGRRGDRAAAGRRRLAVAGDAGRRLGMVGGFSFALNNVMLRREAARPRRAARWRCSPAACSLPGRWRPRWPCTARAVATGAGTGLAPEEHRERGSLLAEPVSC